MSERTNKKSVLDYNGTLVQTAIGGAYCVITAILAVGVLYAHLFVF